MINVENISDATIDGCCAKNILTICLDCGQYTKVFPIQSEFETHTCTEMNFNKFKTSMEILKARATELIESYDIPLTQSLPIN